MIADCIAVVGESMPGRAELCEIRSRIGVIRPELSENDEEYRAAVLLLAGPLFEFNVDRLTRRTKYRAQFVAMCARRLFDNGVWKADGPVYLWEDAREFNFWRDVDVAIGRSYRRAGVDGRVEWGRIESWRKKYDFAEDADAPVPIVYVTDAPEKPSAEPERPVKIERRSVSVIPQHPIAARHVVPVPAMAAETPHPAPAKSVLPDLFPDAKWL